MNPLRFCDVPLTLIFAGLAAPSAEIGISLKSTIPSRLGIEIRFANPGVAYDISFASAPTGPFEISLRGTPGQRLFEYPLPSTPAGFFRAVEAVVPIMLDFDEDGIPNVDELLSGTDPFNWDSDGDGVSDQIDILPLNPAEGPHLVFDPSDHRAPIVTLVVPFDAVRIR